jgi:hypothetical protein
VVVFVARIFQSLVEVPGGTNPRPDHRTVDLSVFVPFAGVWLDSCDGRKFSPFIGQGHGPSQTMTMQTHQLRQSPLQTYSFIASSRCSRKSRMASSLTSIAEIFSDCIFSTHLYA